MSFVLQLCTRFMQSTIASARCIGGFQPGQQALCDTSWQSDLETASLLEVSWPARLVGRCPIPCLQLFLFFGVIRIHVLDFLSIYTKYVIYNIYIEILGLSLTKLLSLGKMPANIRTQHQGHSSWHWVRLQSGGSGKLDPESSRHMIESGLVLPRRKAIRAADQIVDQKKRKHEQLSCWPPNGSVAGLSPFDAVYSACTSAKWWCIWVVSVRINKCISIDVVLIYTMFVQSIFDSVWPSKHRSHDSPATLAGQGASCHEHGPSHHHQLWWACSHRA